MRVAAGVERITHELCVVGVAKRDAGLRQHHGAEFDVEFDLEDAGGFQERLQRRERIAHLDLVRRQAGGEQPAAVAGLFVAERNVAGLVGLERKRDAADLGLHRVFRACLDFKRKLARIARASDPGLQLGDVANGPVFLAIDRHVARLPRRAPPQAPAACP